LPAHRYSHGCTFEFAVAVEAGLPTHDASAHSLSVEEGVRLIEEAVGQCQRRGIDSRPLADHLEKVRARIQNPPPAHNAT
jgi:hypothetical protein